MPGQAERLQRRVCGRQVVIKMIDGSAIKNMLVEAKRCWFKVKEASKEIVHVKRGFVKSVEVSEERASRPEN